MYNVWLPGTQRFCNTGARLLGELRLRVARSPTASTRASASHGLRKPAAVDRQAGRARMYWTN